MNNDGSASNMRMAFIKAVLPFPEAMTQETVALDKSAVNALSSLMETKQIEPKDLVQHARAMYVSGAIEKVPEGFRARPVENWLDGGARANRELFEFALKVAQDHPGKNKPVAPSAPMILPRKNGMAA
jgi:hypothetical protein